MSTEQRQVVRDGSVYLDLVALKYAGWVNSLDGYILSHLNLYDGFDEMEVCVAYEIDGVKTTDFPSSTVDLDKVKPVLKSLPGWEGKVGDARCWDDIPEGAKEVIKFIEDYTDVPVAGYSVGPLRDETFMKEPAWNKILILDFRRTDLSADRTKNT